MSQEQETKNKPSVDIQALILRSLPAVAVIAALMYAFREGLLLMVDWWERMPEYNHGYLIPVVAAYLLLLCAERYKTVEKRRAWTGIPVIAFGLLLLVLGELLSLIHI